MVRAVVCCGAWAELKPGLELAHRKEPGNRCLPGALELFGHRTCWDIMGQYRP